jgi:antitoxin component of RelBE/YafQ-DinJ toxin-antitoxin module
MSAKTPKNIRFNEYILDEALKVQRMKGISFSNLVRLALQDYIKRHLYS